MAGKGGDDGFHRLAVFRAPGEGAVEIHDMQILRASLGKQQRLRRGIVSIHCSAVHIALGQADDLTGLEIDGGGKQS